MNQYEFSIAKGMSFNVPRFHAATRKAGLPEFGAPPSIVADESSATLDVFYGSALSEDDEAILDAKVAEEEAISEVPTLAEAKAIKMSQIDNRTAILILGGFVYGGKNMSLSLQAQSNLHTIKQAKADLSYPVKVNTIDNLDVLELADESAAVAFYTAAVDQCRSVLDGGTALKDQVRAASDLAAVDAVLDQR